MQLLAYIIIYPIFWIISILPFRLLYALSDLVYFIIYRILAYRKGVVVSNMKLALPHKTDKEVKQIAKAFYHHLCDLFLEMIKTLSISKKELNQRFVIKNIKTIRQLESHNTSIVLMYGHYASYEWSTVLQSVIHMPGLGIYKKIANTYFDRLVKRIRSKYNTELVDSKSALALIKDLHRKNDHRMIGFLSDQSPKLQSNNIWLDFMGIKVPCFIGAESVAKKYNYPVGYLKIEKVKRGFYEAEVIVLSEFPQKEDKLSIIKKFNRELEQQIKARPEFYLWTHKRWKHKDKAPVSETNN